jgi:hypothetical protein
MEASIRSRRRRFRLGERILHLWKRHGNHFTFIGHVSAVDQAFALKRPVGWIGVTLEVVGQ